MRFTFLAIFMSAAYAQVTFPVVLIDADQQPTPVCFHSQDARPIACSDELLDRITTYPGIYVTADGQAREYTVTDGSLEPVPAASWLVVPPMEDNGPMLTPPSPTLLDVCLPTNPSIALPWMLAMIFLAIAIRRRKRSPHAGEIDVLHLKPVAAFIQEVAKAVEWLVILLGPRWASLVIFMLLAFGAYALYCFDHVLFRLLDLLGRAVTSAPLTVIVTLGLMIGALLPIVVFVGRRRHMGARTWPSLWLQPTIA